MGLRLVVENICRGYNGNQVLNGCSYSFASGGIYALMGQNGSGKSTFLRICSLLENPDKGKVNFYSNNEPLKKDIELRRRLTLVLPGVGIFNTSVFNNVAYGLTLRGIGKKEKTERVERMLEFAGLVHKKNHKAQTLSSGEMQRLGIARAMAIEPEVLFLDEPTASVDYQNTEIIEDIILKMKNSGDITIIIATHDKPQAERLAKNILLLQNGKVIDHN